jgi:hypothetical protein
MPCHANVHSRWGSPPTIRALFQAIRATSRRARTSSSVTRRVLGACRSHCERVVSSPVRPASIGDPACWRMQVRVHPSTRRRQMFGTAEISALRRLPQLQRILDVPESAPSLIKLELWQLEPDQESSFSSSFAEPSDGLEPSTPSLPCAPKRLPWVATGCESACLRRFRGGPICHRLPPVALAWLHKCSIPSLESQMNRGIRMVRMSVVDR